jgi:hypothetical protein
MAKKTAKRVKARKTKRSSVVAKGVKTAKAATKPTRPGGSHVSFGLHGITEIMKKVHEAGLQSEFDKAVGHDHQFVRVQRESLRKIKEFVASKPQLTGLARDIQKCDCPSWDPYCIYI